MSFTPAALWECAEREVRRRKLLLERIDGVNKVLETEIEMMTEIAKILRDRAQGELPL